MTPRVVTNPAQRQRVRRPLTRPSAAAAVRPAPSLPSTATTTAAAAAPGSGPSSWSTRVTNLAAPKDSGSSREPDDDVERIGDPPPPRWPRLGHTGDGRAEDHVDADLLGDPRATDRDDQRRPYRQLGEPPEHRTAVPEEHQGDVA